MKEHTKKVSLNTGNDFWNRIIGPRGDDYSGTGYTLKEGGNPRHFPEEVGALGRWEAPAKRGAELSDFEKQIASRAAKRYLESLSSIELHDFLSTLDLVYAG